MITAYGRHTYGAAKLVNADQPLFNEYIKAMMAATTTSVATAAYEGARYAAGNNPYTAPAMQASAFTIYKTAMKKLDPSWVAPAKAPTSQPKAPSKSAIDLVAGLVQGATKPSGSSAGMSSAISSAGGAQSSAQSNVQSGVSSSSAAGGLSPMLKYALIGAGVLGVAGAGYFAYVKLK